MTLAVPADAAVRARHSPYQGLVPYSEFDAEWFFGRDEWSAVVADNLRAYRITVLYGASGVGKSSLLHAGMIRELNDEARENVVDHGVPRLLPIAFSAWSLDDPLSALKDALFAAGEQEPLEGSLSDVLDEMPLRVGGPVLLVLDQLEELFVYHERSGDPTIEELAVLLRRRDPAVHFLLSIREDALADLDRFEGQVSGLGDHLLRLDQLDRDAGREAITAPLELWNRVVADRGHEVEIEPELVETVLDQVTTGRVSLGDDNVAVSNGNRAAGIEAPYLQLVLVHLWEQERNQGSNTLRFETLERLGGAGRIVRTHLDSSLGSLPVAEQDLAGRTLRFLVTPSGTKIALRTSDLADYAEVPADLLEPLIERLAGPARVLRPAGDGRYEIYHDALAGPILDWRRRWEERRRQRRERRRLLVLASAVAVLLSVVVGVSLLAIWALDQRHTARRAATSATSLALASVANVQRLDRYDASLLLAREAYLMDRSEEARASLISTLEDIKLVGAAGVLHGHTSVISGLAYSPDGRTLASSSSDQTVRLWDARTHRPLGQPFRAHTTHVHGVAFSADGRTVASWDDHGTLRLWDARTHEQHGPPIRGGLQWAFSPDGRTLASSANIHASGRTDGKIHLWDVTTHRQLAQALRGAGGDLNTIAFSPDGRLLASGGDDGTVRLWDVRSRRELGSPLRGHSGSVRAVAFGPDGRTLASGGADGTVRLWDVRSHRQLGRSLRGHGASVLAVAFSPDGRTVASAGGDSAVRLWDVRRQQLGRTLYGHSGAVYAVAFGRDGRTLASGGDDGVVRLWNTRSDRELGQPLETRGPHLWSAVAFSSDGRNVAGAGSAVERWDVRSHRPLGRPRPGLAALGDVVFAPDGLTLAIPAGNTLLLWDVVRNKQVGKPIIGSGAVFGAAFTPDGRRLATVWSDGTVQIWDTSSHLELGEPFAGRAGTLNGIAFSPDGRTLATAGGDSTVRLWDVRTHEQVGRPLRGHTAAVYTVAFSPDGRTLASGGNDWTVRLWDVRDHRQIGHPLRGHTAFVSAFAFSPDGQTLASASYDGTVRLWDVRSHDQLGPLHGHAGYVKGVAFSPDGRTLASVGDDGTVRLWEGFLFAADDLAYLQQRVCTFAGGNLSRDEWAQFAPQIPYRATCP